MGYTDYFHFDREPFSNAPNDKFYFDSEQHTQALLRLKYSVDSDKGLAVLVGGVGTGKTTLARRMLDEGGVPVAPGSFLGAAERYNLAPQLDRWVVKTVFEWFSAHPEQLQRLGTCSINLSGLSLGDTEFASFLEEMFALHKLPPEKICFEITETAVIANLSTAVAFIERLRRLGCVFALDDFGSGLSSFSYLKNLSVDFLKIDGSFVKNMVNDIEDLAMVEAINQVGHVMGMQTIAEFVEDEEILAKLIEINVDYAQGYGIARPEPLSNLLLTFENQGARHVNSNISD